MPAEGASEIKLDIGHALFIDIVGRHGRNVGLEKAYEQQDSACWYLTIDQIYDNVRSEPRFQELVKKIFGETK